MSHKYWTEVGDLGTSYGNVMVNTLSEERISFDTYMRILEINQRENGKNSVICNIIINVCVIP